MTSMKTLFEDGILRQRGATLFEGKKKNGLQEFLAKHGIVGEKSKPEHCVNSIGFSEREQKWYGWSHRAISGFGKGDMIFEPDFGDDKTPFREHGSKPIKNMEDARKAAVAFARDVS